MKNSRWSYVAGMVAALLFVSCGGQSKQKAESEMNTDSTKVADAERQYVGYTDTGRNEGDMDS